MSISLLIAVFGLVLFPYLKTFMSLFFLAILSAVFFSATMPLSASATMFMLGARKDLYGRIRLGGTIGFAVVATLAGALVENYGLKIAFWSAAGLFFLAFVISQKLEHGGESGPSVDRTRASELLKNPHFLLFLLLGFAGGVSFATINTYLFPYMKSLGAGESLMGLALTMGTVVEIPVLFFVNRFIRRYRAYAVVVFSIAMTALRFLLLAVAADPVFVLFIQLFNGVNHPLLTVAGVTYTDEHAPRRFRATAQGLFNVAMGGIGTAVGGFVGGLLFDSVGARGMYLFFGILLLFTLAFVTFVRRTLPPEPVTVGTVASS